MSNASAGPLSGEFSLEPISLSMEGLCLEMRLVKLQHLVALPRNGRYAILLGEAEHGSYKVAIPGDGAIFGLNSKNINFLPELKGYTMSQNVLMLKRHRIDVLNAWKDIYVDPNSIYSMGSSLGVQPDDICSVRHKIPDQILFGVAESPCTIVFGLINIEEMDSISKRLHEKMLFMCWHTNDMPYRDPNPLSETPMRSCNDFYGTRFREVE